MLWRLYDIVKCRWYNAELYETREACIAAADRLRQKARLEGDLLELFSEPLDPTEALTVLTQQ